MNKRIASIILAIVLALILWLPTLAAGNGTVTITMLTDKDVDITLEPTEWNIGDIEPNTEYVTKPTWCTVSNEGNCVVEIRIKGKNAMWIDDPNAGESNAYEWKLSSDNTTAKRKYALWYHVARDDADSYTPITTIDTQMKKANGDVIKLVGNGVQKQFGLKLLTPKPDANDYFYGDREMETTITISAVSA